MKTNEDTEQELRNLYEKLGQCTADKKEIRSIVDQINSEE